MGDGDLLVKYIETFWRFDDLSACDVPESMRTTDDGDGYSHWRPVFQPTPPSALSDLYRALGLDGGPATRLPRLYESLVLSYRWLEVDLGAYRLVANRPAEDLSPLLECLQEDEALLTTLRPNGYFQFAKGADMDYDPVCFDFRNRRSGGDCRIVKLDHESILCDGEICEVAELAPSFRALVEETVRRAST
jgi:hypothetical protein